MDYVEDSSEGIWADEDRYRRGSGYKRNGYKRHGRAYCADFSKDPDFYHRWVEFERIVASTEKSHLIEFRRLDKPVGYWVAKSLVRKWDEQGKRMFVHWPTLAKILRTQPVAIVE